MDLNALGKEKIFNISNSLVWGMGYRREGETIKVRSFMVSLSSISFYQCRGEDSGLNGSLTRNALSTFLVTEPSDQSENFYF